MSGDGRLPGEDFDRCSECDTPIVKGWIFGMPVQQDGICIDCSEAARKLVSNVGHEGVA